MRRNQLPGWLAKSEPAYPVNRAFGHMSEHPVQDEFYAAMTGVRVEKGKTVREVETRNALGARQVSVRIIGDGGIVAELTSENGDGPDAYILATALAASQVDRLLENVDGQQVVGLPELVEAVKEEARTAGALHRAKGRAAYLEGLTPEDENYEGTRKELSGLKVELSSTPERGLARIASMGPKVQSVKVAISDVHLAAEARRTAANKKDGFPTARPDTSQRW